MYGIKWLVAELYKDALMETCRIFPPWVIMWGIHPDDRDAIQDQEPIDYYIAGSRAVVQTPDGEKTIAFWDCVCNICKYAEYELLMRFMKGIQSIHDCDLLCQYAVFGEIKYPKVGEEAHHDVQAV